MSTPTAVEELLDEISSVDGDRLCFYDPTAYPNGRVACRYWTRIFEGCWGRRGSGSRANAAEAHALRDDLVRNNRVHVESKALNDWVWSKYIRDYHELCDDLYDQSRPSDATDVPFEDLYEAYIATGSVCSSVTRIFFAKSLFYEAGRAPHKSADGIYTYRLRPLSPNAGLLASPFESRDDGAIVGSLSLIRH
jgi:hypothetical protein